MNTAWNCRVQMSMPSPVYINPSEKSPPESRRKTGGRNRNNVYRLRVNAAVRERTDGKRRAQPPCRRGFPSTAAEPGRASLSAAHAHTVAGRAAGTDRGRGRSRHWPAVGFGPLGPRRDRGRPQTHRRDRRVPYHRSLRATPCTLGRGRETHSRRRSFLSVFFFSFLHLSSISFDRLSVRLVVASFSLRASDRTRSRRRLPPSHRRPTRSLDRPIGRIRGSKLAASSRIRFVWLRAKLPPAVR